MTIRVLVVDDSALIRSVLQSIINEQWDMQVVGLAPDARIARELVRELNPDVITLDVEMPGVDGLTFLQQLMQEMPKPVLMVSSHTQAGSDIAFRALEIGAVDFIAKPKLSAGSAQNYGDLLADKIRAASRARLELHAPHRPFDALPALAAGSTEKAKSAPPATPKVAFMGASTGGTEAIRAILAAMPVSCPPVLIVQHLPENFSRPFASRLDGLCQIAVKEAEHGEPLLPGHAYIAPGNAHLTIREAAVHRYVVELTHTGFVNLHRPSIDVLFGSAAKCMGSGAIGVMLSGMGKDGPSGMLELKQSGARTIAQDEKSSVVFGMSRDAIQLGAVEETLPLSGIATRLCELATAPAASDA
ncbi:MAG: chemotaxis response regulator protein-glutamate methylesterase [Burkholderiales bacterium]|nr:chemotaxis response regulator protein-glutamate methylesterase [Burkholderiales bacterium]